MNMVPALLVGTAVGGATSVVVQQSLATMLTPTVVRVMDLGDAPSKKDVRISQIKTLAIQMGIAIAAGVAGVTVQLVVAELLSDENLLGDGSEQIIEAEVSE